MHFSLKAPLFLLALASILVDPVDATKIGAPKRHLLKRATDSFHKTALRHSASLARDLRIAFRGLGPVRVSAAGSNKAFCVSNPGALTPSKVTNSSGDHHSSTAKATSTSKSSPTANGSPGTNSSSTGTTWRLAQSYVRFRSANFTSVPEAP